MLKDKNILLIISGGIAAYKSLELIRLIRKSGGHVKCILTNGAQQFVTPMSVAALSENPAYTDLWSLKDETEMGHIRLTREADLVVIAPASANIIAKMANGLADDLVSTTLLASDKRTLIAPAMNHKMWSHPATQKNIKTLSLQGIEIIGPDEGDMACGEFGPGRMSEPEVIFSAITDFFLQTKPLNGLSALVTSGPTYEPLDPVRFIGNKSSGKQGHAIAASLAAQGASVTLVTGPVALPDPFGVKTVHIETADQMWEACENALPADIAVCAAAVSDWGPKVLSNNKIKKRKNHTAPKIDLKENPDILARLSKNGKNRPALVIGFAAETENLIKNATEKRKRKACDWLLANNVGEENIFGADENHVYLMTNKEPQDWQRISKQAVAQKLTHEITEFFKQQQNNKKVA